MANQAEGTFGRLRYIFRRRPPQSNCPPVTVPDPDHGPGLEPQYAAGWYFNVDSTEADAPASKTPTYPTQHIPKPNTKLQ